MPKQRTNHAAGIDLGTAVVDEHRTRRRVALAQTIRCQHIFTLGRSGSGKSSFLKHLEQQDVRADHGLLAFDFHAEIKPFLLRLIAQEERRRGRDLSRKLIIIDPTDDWSVGINILERQDQQQVFTQLAEVAEILRRRWALDHLGARTSELLRNSLHLLADNEFTLCELGLLLTNAEFRTTCLQRATNPEVAAYFQTRFDQASDAMQSVLRDAILNKISAFTADPRFRHILGQRRSTFSLLDAIDNGYWVIVDLNKGHLGGDAATLGSLLFTRIKNALFARRSRRLFTVYADEIQNLTHETGIETVYSEARKFGASIVCASQYLDQYSPSMRAAILAVGTHAFFQLSAPDAAAISNALDGGKRLAELLKNLPQRHFVIKTGHSRWQEAVVPTVVEPTADYTDLLNRCRVRWARRRADIEAEIRARHQQAARRTNEVLHEWE